MRCEIIKFKTAKMFYEIVGYRLKKDEVLEWYDENGNLTDGLKHFFLSDEDLDVEKVFAAPPQCFVQRFLREKYDIHIVVEPTIFKKFQFTIYKSFDRIETYPRSVHETFEQAKEIALQFGLKMIKNGTARIKETIK